MADTADSHTATGYITYRPRYTCEHQAEEQISVRDAVRAIQQWLQDYEARITAAIESGRTYYVHNKIHSVDCPSLKRGLVPTASWYWVEETDDPEVIGERYADITEIGGGYAPHLAGRLVTREEAGQSALKRCRTCVPDVNPRTVGKRAKKVAGLGAGDLGRLLNGHLIESITHEPGVVIVRTSATSHRFDVAASVVLDTASIDPAEAEASP
ncbi:hypothetical protein [Nocardia sp. NPDC051570]|uniref:hypothetical protein n=1 Tax=Nocardia sp. NPDC051570 TaxID=3364324 RepID=UPI0037BCA002